MVVYSIKQKIKNLLLITRDTDFKYYNLITEIKATFARRKKSSFERINIIRDNDSLSIFSFGDGFLFYYPGRLNSYALEWNYYETVLNPYSGHYYEKFGAKVNPGDIVFDCGSCEGFFAYKVRNLAEKIYCFEPNANMAKCLAMTFKDSKNVHVVEKGLGAKSEVIQFVGNSFLDFRNKQNKGKGSLVQEVSCISGDEFVEENRILRIDFLKIDVEGSEIEVINGFKKSISKFKPKIAITTYHRASDARVLTDAILNIVPKYNFKLNGIVSKGVFEEEEMYNKPRPMMAFFWT